MQIHLINEHGERVEIGRVIDLGQSEIIPINNNTVDTEGLKWCNVDCPISFTLVPQWHKANTPKARRLTRKERKAIIRKVAKTVQLPIREIHAMNWKALQETRTKRPNPKLFNKRGKESQFRKFLEQIH